jgi:hypothetical protein
LAQERYTVMNLWVYKMWEYTDSWWTITFSRRTLLHAVDYLHGIYV